MTDDTSAGHIGTGVYKPYSGLAIASMLCSICGIWTLGARPDKHTVGMPSAARSDDRRGRDLELVSRALGDSVIDETLHSVVALGDALSLLKAVPDQSVSLVLCDPPYHSTQKANVPGDRSFRKDADFIEWMREFAREWRRVLRMSGTVYVFCSPQMSSRLEVALSEFLLPVSGITWTKPNEPGYDGWKGKMRKESLRQWYPHSERILMFEQGSYGDHMSTRRTPLAQYLRDCRTSACLTTIELTSAIGAHGRVNHGGVVSNWESGRNIPSRAQYEQIAAAVWASTKSLEMLPYEDVVRPMSLSADVAFTDVWSFESVRPFKGKHPAAKPCDLLEHIIEASTYPGDIVLDCFAGSGSTGIAATRRGRRTVCIDIDEKWTIRSAQDIGNELLASGLLRDDTSEHRFQPSASESQGRLPIE